LRTTQRRIHNSGLGGFITPQLVNIADINPKKDCLHVPTALVNPEQGDLVNWLGVTIEGDTAGQLYSQPVSVNEKERLMREINQVDLSLSTLWINTNEGDISLIMTNSPNENVVSLKDMASLSSSVQIENAEQLRATWQDCESFADAARILDNTVTGIN